MARSAATSVEESLRQLPDDRRAVLADLRKLILENLPKGYRESVNMGMLCYGIPLERDPDTYNGQPLGYVSLAAQKNDYALYLMGAYMDPAQAEALRDAFAKAGKKFDMGKSCLRFKKPEDLALDAVAKLIASTPPEKFIAMYESSRPPARSRAGNRS